MKKMIRYIKKPEKHFTGIIEQQQFYRGSIKIEEIYRKIQRE